MPALVGLKEVSGGNGVKAKILFKGQEDLKLEDVSVQVTQVKRANVQLVLKLRKIKKKP